MKNYLTLAFLLLSLIFISCDKNDPLPDPEPEDEFSTDYSQMFTTEKLGDVGRFLPLKEKKYGQMADINGNMYSQWKSMPNLLGGKEIGIQWGSPGAPGETFAEQMGTEIWSIKYDCETGHNYVYLEGYGDDEGNIWWGARLTKAILINLSTGKKFDISNVGNCGEGIGHPYMLFDLYEQPYIIKIWHDIVDHRKGDGVTLKRVYWEQTVRPFIEIENPIWEGEGTNKRMTIKQTEAWWDSDQGWEGNSSGEMESLPSPIYGISSAGYQEPTGENVVSWRDQWFGEGVDGDESGWFVWKHFDRSNNLTGYLKHGWKY